MHPSPPFQEIPYGRPNMDVVKTTAETLLERWDQTTSCAEQIALILEWDKNRGEFETNRTMAMVHFRQHTTDPACKAEQEHYDNVMPVILEQNVAFLERVTSSPIRAELEKELGSQVFALWDCFLGTFNPDIAEHKRREAKLRNEYAELLAGLECEFQGKTYTLSELQAFYGDPDRATRLAAQQTKDRVMSAISEPLDRIYHDLVQVRHEMAQALGYETFTPLGYRNMDRTDYNAEDVAEYRKQVRETVVPLAQKIYKRRSQAINIEEISFHDESVRDLKGVPCPKGDHDWMIERATEMFDTLGDDFGYFFRMMTDCELLDLKSRPGKSGGGFCADIPRYGVPFIFANFNGTQDDVNVFTHECGHAFQNWSARHHTLLAYHWPTIEAAEIHSMSLEFLTYPHMEQFFGDDAARFREGHLEGAILFMPYGCAVDEFQHRVYENPTMTPTERAEVWKELEAIYLPHRKYDGMEHNESGRLWQSQRHIYGMPFYYIDYCLAQTCALQMWNTANQDRDDTMERYRKLCSLGGSLHFTKLLDEVGLVSPFDENCLKDVCAAVQETLGLS